MCINVVFLDVTQNYGYCFSASNTKFGLVAKGLTRQGDSCTIHNGIVGTNIISAKTDIVEDGVGRIVTLTQRKNQLFSWIYNVPQLYSDLKSIYRRGAINIMILACVDYHLFLTYVLLGRVLGYKISVVSHEWAPTVNAIRWFRKPSVWLYTKTFGFFSDSILPISEYIIKKIGHFNKPYYKLPILGDFNEELPTVDAKQPYFVYCGASDYFRVIKVLLMAIKHLQPYNGINYRLVLVLGGTERGQKIIRDFIKVHQMQDFVQIKRNVQYNELVQLYMHAKGLLIPLDPNSEQDHARFSQKIAEYLSTETPVITNSVGEIPFYFTDKENIVCCPYSVDGFSNAMKWITDNPKQAEIIGKLGYRLGREKFNYQTHGKNLHDFYLKLYD